MGIRQYHNKWRAYIVDKDGTKHQKYFDTKQLAQAFYDVHYKDKHPFARYKKRSDAKTKDLAVGLCLTFEVYHPVSGGETIRRIIKATAKVEGQLKHFQRSFGKNRARKKAIKLCLAWRIKQLKGAANA